MTKHHHTLLCLGDSYTIGESVPLHESFPYQTVQLLRTTGLHVNAPEIVAQTGWASFELAEHILHTKLNEHYDFVTLLIGVNNQYRGLDKDDFKNDFEYLLQKAIHFATGKNKHVTVLSIPDWGVTPFAKGKEAEKISKKIDEFNIICESVVNKHQTHYINITEETRKAKNDKSLLANDQLHYSQKEYRVWAEKVSAIIKNQLK